MFRDYVSPVLGGVRMIDVRAPEIGRVLGRAQDLGLGAQTRKHIYSLLRKMFGDAVEYYEMLTQNPVKPKHHRPSVSGKERAFLLPAQAWQLLERVRDHYMGPAIWLQTLAGLRVGEVQYLRWKSLRFELDQVLIQGTWNKKTRQEQPFPKQTEWGIAPMLPELKKYLLTLQRQPDEYVVQGRAGGMLPYDTYEGGLKRLCRDAGVPPISTHELRHTCTEIWVQAGASAEDIRRLLNQSSLTATAAYIHRTDERLNRIGAGITPTANYTGNYTVVEKEPCVVTSDGGRNVH
jgi:integrase